jgi:hypothetical protein
MALSNFPTMQSMPNKPGCTQPYTWHEVSSHISHLRAAGKSFRQIAKDDYKGRVSHAVIQRVAAGNEPREPRIREALALPAYHQVVVIAGGEVPPGTQVISALQCECEQWFIPNTPNRKRCFICSPFRKTKREAH